MLAPVATCIESNSEGHAINEYGGVELKLQEVLYLKLEVSNQLQVPAVLLTGTSVAVPTEREAGWTPEPVCTFGKMNYTCQDSN